MTVAWVLSGGASLGAVQVGMAAALGEQGLKPDMIVGTSVGAINGAWLAGKRDIDGLDRLWRGLRRSQLFPLRPLAGLRGFIGQTSHLIPNRGVRGLIRSHLTFDRLEDAPIPFTVIAADASTGAEVPLSHGPALQAVLASAALPGVSEVWGFSTGYSCGLQHPPDRAIDMAMHAVALLVQQRLVLETRDREFPVPVHLIPPPCPIEVTPADFSQTDMLINRAAAGTRQWLSNGCPHALPLALGHRHSPG